MDKEFIQTKRNYQMTFKKNGQGQKVITVGLFKALSIVGTAILVAIVSTAFATVGILNGDHFALIANANDIADLQENSATKTELSNAINSFNDYRRIEEKRFDEIKTSLDTLIKIHLIN